MSSDPTTTPGGCGCPCHPRGRNGECRDCRGRGDECSQRPPVSARLDFWQIVLCRKPRKAGGFALRGIVRNHPFVRDGTEVTTSRLLSLDLENLEAECASRVYEIGLPDQGWLERLNAGGYSLAEFESALRKERAA